MTSPAVRSQPLWPIRAGLAGAVVAVAVLAAGWLLGMGIDVDAPAGWLVAGIGAAGWTASMVAGCYGPLPAGRARNVVLDAAMGLSAVSVLVLLTGAVLAAVGA